MTATATHQTTPEQPNPPNSEASREDQGTQGQPPDAHRLLTAAELAERLGVTSGWVYAACRANRLPHVRLGRYVRFRADAVDRWLAELESAGGPASLIR